MGLGNQVPEDDSNDDENSDGPEEQSKSLWAHVYDSQTDDKYRDISDWHTFDQYGPFVYEIASGGGSLRRWMDGALTEHTPFADREDYTAALLFGLANSVGSGTITEASDYDDIELSGTLNEMFEVLFAGADDIVNYAQYLTEEDTAQEPLSATHIAEIVDSSEGDTKRQFYAIMDSMDGVDVDEDLLPDDEE